ncbi:MAG: AmmeMemoRadiSam system radical SAM enzyme, partial [Candidatus Omnitrophica bacterium]|nr:AmmeMemoRadiSam system radical SAM enzyme [Candidatus Omnitrophota bacterium]
MFFFVNESQKWRRGVLVTNIVILGLISTEMLSLSLFDTWVKSGIQFFDPAFLIMAVSVIVAIARNKNFYCTLVCPYGALQEFLGQVKKEKQPMPHKVSRFFYWVGLIYFSLIAGILLTGISLNLDVVEPFRGFSISKAPVITLGIFIVFLGASIFFPRLWCNFFCPTGRILGGFLKKEDRLKKPPILVFLFCATLAATITWIAHQPLKQTASSVAPPAQQISQSSVAPKLETKINFHPASFFKALADHVVQCVLCPRQCVLKDGETGFCRARKNINGTLYALTYGQPVALHVDPIEKKPFAHVYPGTKSFSLATAGCNLRCKFCQNWEISQLDAEAVKGDYVSPEDIVAKAKEGGSKTIAFTYTEPTIFYEYMLDIAKVAKKEGIACVMHSAGFINEEPLRELCKYLVAANIDLKSFDEKFYHTFTQGRLESVLNTLKILKSEGVWVEITNLLIPGVNDSPEEITNLCTWVKENLGKDTPVHFSRFFPMYKLANLSPTPVSSLERAYEIAKKIGLEFVYVGNIPDQVSEDTFCPACKKLLIKRIGYEV